MTNFLQDLRMKPTFIIAAALLLLSACQAAPTAAPSATPTAAEPTPQPTATFTPTPEPPKSLVVCIGQEPQTLYMYAGNSRAMWSVLEAVYDGPIDMRGYTPVPVILEKLPALADGDALVQPVDVLEGQAVLDADGNFTYLKAGARYLPSGCSSDACAVTWDGTSPVQMDRLQLTFKLLPGLLWSDGAPLTADDSVYSFELASDPDTPVNKRIVERTVSYTSPDAVTVQWQGIPGYFPQTYEGLFFSPLPRHTWGLLGAADLLKADLSNTTPLGWGPYVIQEWVKGDHITLARNPNYFRAAEGLPEFETLVYRFLGENADSNLEALLVGECDIVDQTTLLEDQLGQVIELQGQRQLLAFVGLGPEVEQLVLGIRPASYDDGFTPGSDRPDFFGDLRTRQAIAYCLDRATLIASLRSGQGQVAVGMVPPASPFYPSDLSALPYDPAQGARLLDEVGWKDSDNNPDTPRVAQGVAGVPDGTPFVIEYATSQASLRLKVADLLIKSLAGCGIQANLNSYNVSDLYAAGPDGILFGRKFDLAQFAWAAARLPSCGLYETGQVPNAANSWLGGNITGFSNAEYDAACQAARASRPGDGSDPVALYQQVQRIFADQLPAIPLYYDVKLAATRLDVCNFSLDVSARSDLWNLEAISRNCP